MSGIAMFARGKILIYVQCVYEFVSEFRFMEFVGKIETICLDS